MNNLAARKPFLMFSKIASLSYNIQKYSSVTVLALMVLIIGLQVFFRYFLNQPLSWTEELARLFQIWVVFLIIGYLLGRREHIEISYFAERLPSRIQLLLRSFTDITILIFSIFLIGWGIKLGILQYAAKSTALELPLTYFSLPFCLSSIFVIIHAVILLVQDLSDIKNK